jgi:SAM-dependent methyltransferase
MLKKFRCWIRYNLLYLGKPPWDTGISPPELINFLENHPPGVALDVGCGTGTNLLTMAEHGWRVVGMDIALLSVLNARKKLGQAGYQAKVIVGDVTGDPGFENPFDLVLDIGCYHSLSEKGREAYRQNLYRWLKPGGHYLIYAHRCTSPTSSHGISQGDIEAFDAFLDLQWQTDQQEKRPDGSGGRSSTWAQFHRTNH